MWRRSSGWSNLNQLVTLYVESHQFTTRGQVVPISAISFCWQLRWEINLSIVLRKVSPTTLVMMCSITRSSWCAPHHILNNGQSLCTYFWSLVTTPAALPVMLRAPSDATPSVEICQLAREQSRSCKVFRTLHHRYDIHALEIAHPCKLSISQHVGEKFVVWSPDTACCGELHYQLQLRRPMNAWGDLLSFEDLLHKQLSSCGSLHYNGELVLMYWKHPLCAASQCSPPF